MNAADYMKLPYNINIKRVEDESGAYYFATVLELDGCMSHGETIEEASVNIREAMEGWIETKLEAGYEVPKPFSPETYSGKFMIRIPKTLHARLVREAENEGISLNQYALYKLSAGM
jgi:predicted RNase H-like HicB family nuclease